MRARLVRAAADEADAVRAAAGVEVEAAVAGYRQEALDREGDLTLVYSTHTLLTCRRFSLLSSRLLPPFERTRETALRVIPASVCLLCYAAAAAACC